MEALLEQYRDTLIRQKTACQFIDAEIEQVKAQYQAEMEAVDAKYTPKIDALAERRRLVSQPYVQLITTLTEQITAMSLQLAKTMKYAAGVVKYVKGRTTRSWSLDNMDALYVTHPDVWKVISPYRTETHGEPKVTIEINQ